MDTVKYNLTGWFCETYHPGACNLKDLEKDINYQVQSYFMDNRAEAWSGCRWGEICGCALFSLTRALNNFFNHGNAHANWPFSLSFVWNTVCHLSSMILNTDIINNLRAIVWVSQFLCQCRDSLATGHMVGHYMWLNNVWKFLNEKNNTGMRATTNYVFLLLEHCVSPILDGSLSYHDRLLANYNSFLIFVSAWRFINNRQQSSNYKMTHHVVWYSRYSDGFLHTIISTTVSTRKHVEK